jgi:hypothetical protein
MPMGYLFSLTEHVHSEAFALLEKEKKTGIVKACI